MHRHIPGPDSDFATCVALQYETNVFVIRGDLDGPRGLPRDCEPLCATMRLISLRSISPKDSIAIFVVPEEDEMAEILETIDGRSGHHAMCLDGRGRPNEHYFL